MIKLLCFFILNICGLKSAVIGSLRSNVSDLLAKPSNSSSEILLGSETLNEEVINPSIIVTAVVFLIGLLVQVVRAFGHDKRRRGHFDKENIYASMLEEKTAEIANKIIRSVQKGANEENNRHYNRHYRQLHKIEGGVGLLVGSGLCLLSTPERRHTLAKQIFAEERKIHQTDNEVFLCMRRKCHSRERFLWLDHIQPPSVFKKLVYQLTQRPMDWILEKDNWFATIVVGLVLGAVPVARITLHIWDFTKNAAMFVYLYQRLTFIKFDTIHKIIKVYGISVVLSSVMMCWNTQTNSYNGIINPNKINHKALRLIARVLLFVLTLVIPFRYCGFKNILKIITYLYVYPQHHLQVCAPFFGNENDGGQMEK